MYNHKLFNHLRRKLLEPLYYKRSGSRFLSYWRDLEKTQWLSQDCLREKQWERLKNLLYFVWNKNTFYRRRFETAGITPESVQSPEDIKLIPILSKEEIRHNTNDMISSGFNKDKLMIAKTGGSTGKALELFYTENCSELRNACARRHDRWSGWEPGEPIAAVWGNPHLTSTIKEKLKNWLITPFIYLDTMNVTEAAVKKFADEWKRVRPTQLFGHAHSIFILAQYVRDLKIETINPKAIISSSMTLLPHERKTIEEVFRVKVIDRYGCEEVSLIGSECERHEGLHMNIEHLFIEFIKDDGTYAKPGEPGHIVVTDLINYAMPFIRYRIEDIGVPTDRKCGCGRGLPLMESVTGRVADFLIKKDGSKVAGVSLIENTLTKIPGIIQMQIIQDKIDLIKLRIVTEQDYSETVKLQLMDYFKSVFDADCRVIVENTDNILPEPSGKYRFSICKIQ